VTKGEIKRSIELELKALANLPLGDDDELQGSLDTIFHTWLAKKEADEYFELVDRMFQYEAEQDECDCPDGYYGD